MIWSSSPAVHGAPADVAVLTVIQPELFAALDALGFGPDAYDKDEAGTIYYRGAVRSARARRDYRVVLSCIGAAGNYDAAAATRDLVAWCKPAAVLLVGIAAGIRGKLKIGDVVLSDRVVAYEPAAAVVGPDGAPREERRPEIDRLPHAMNQDVVSYRPDPARLQAVFAKIHGELPAPLPGQEELFREHVVTALAVRAATIASGEKLLRDPSKLLCVRKEQHGKVEAGEMEAAGLVGACRRGGVPWLVIRGISDFGDTFKDDRFHNLAACAAAAVLADFLAHGLDLPAKPGGWGRSAAALGMALALAGGGFAGWNCVRSGGGESVAVPDANEPAGIPPIPPVAPAPASSTAPAAVGAAPATTPARLSPATLAPPATATAAAAGSAAPRTEASGAATRVTLKNIKAGDGAKIRGGNVDGQGSSDTDVNGVTCGDNCEINVGNVKNR
ncbi:hypothetical protein WME73_24445 [Sorangium sp. So ce302]|uniref:5'-methylthioadenosine/S-adenosylhomocysteine nucleosidase family protein n=1 Tax=Sorangium sp. So ce302 TaxID=3133297 RepID=UPI003F6102D9